MAKATFTVPSFIGGEWSATAQGNIADPKYKVALSLCLNYYPTEQGAIVRRPGTRHIGHTYLGQAARTISFDVKESSPYTLVFTDSGLRFINDRHFATTNDAKTVSSISSASPAVVQTAAPHGWSNGDEVFFPALGTPDPYLLNRRLTATVVDGTHFSIADNITNAAVDGSLLKPFTTGTVSRIAQISTPYTLADWPDVRSVQAELTATFLHGSYIPQIMTAAPSALAAPNDDMTFKLSPANFVDGPYNDPITQATFTPASTSGIVGGTVASPTYSSTTPYNVGDFVVYSSSCYKSLIPSNLGNQPDISSFAWAATTQDKIFGPNGLQTSDIGRHVRLFSEPAAWSGSATYAAGQSVKYNNSYWTSVISNNTANRPGLDLTKWVANAAAAQWTWGKITALTGATATVIAPSLGTIIAGGGGAVNLAGAFNGNPNQGAAAGGYINVNYNASTCYIGKNFTSGNKQKVSYALVYAPNDYKFVYWIGPVSSATLTINLRASNTVPASSNDGTLLGTATSVPSQSAGTIVQINSNDTSTTYQYIWIEFVGNELIFNAYFAQVQFFTATSFSGTGISVQIFGPPLLYSSVPVVTWRMGLFSDQYGWPKCGTYHEGRLWLGGMVDNRFDASALCDINANPATSLFYFTPTLYDGTVSDACGISYTLDGPDVNAMFWMHPEQQGIVIGTQAGEWLVQATANNNILTPTSIQAHRVTKIGCANIEPRRAEHTLLLVQKHLREIVEYFADIFSGKFTAPKLADKAKHLTAGNLAEIAYQQEVTPILWARDEAGGLRGMTYKRDTLMTSQGPTLNGWHQHSLGGGRVVESLAAGPTKDGNLTTLTMVTNDGSGVRTIETMTTEFEEGDDLKDAFFLDNAVSDVAYSSTTVGNNPGVLIYGVWHLNGSTATVFAGGLDAGDWPVNNGAVFVPYYPAGGQANSLFTSAFVAGFSGAMKIVVGYCYTSQAQLVRPDLTELGARNGPGVGKVRRINKFVANLVNTLGISFGTRFSKMYPALFKSVGGASLAANAPFTGLYKEVVSDNSEGYASQICWEQTRPFPGTIASITGFGETEDE